MTTPETILSQLPEKSRHQLELTLCAFARSARKAIRQAELLDRQPETTPAQRQSAWDTVNQRTETLCKFMAALTPAPTPTAAEAVETHAPAPSDPAPAAATEPAPDAEPLDIVTKFENELHRISLLPRENYRDQEVIHQRYKAIIPRIRKEAPAEDRHRLLKLAGVVL